MYIIKQNRHFSPYLGPMKLEPPHLHQHPRIPDNTLKMHSSSAHSLLTLVLIIFWC